MKYICVKFDQGKVDRGGARSTRKATPTTRDQTTEKEATPGGGLAQDTRKDRGARHRKPKKPAQPPNQQRPPDTRGAPNRHGTCT